MLSGSAPSAFQTRALLSCKQKALMASSRAIPHENYISVVQARENRLVILQATATWHAGHGNKALASDDRFASLLCPFLQLGSPPLPTMLGC